MKVCGRRGCPERAAKISNTPGASKKKGGKKAAAKRRKKKS